MGVASVLRRAVSVMRTRAAAPSLRVLALAAVTVPPSASFTKAGFREANFSKLALTNSHKIVPQKKDVRQTVHHHLCTDIERE